MTLPKDRKDWPVKWRDAFEERAAIREFDGGMPRKMAEWMTEADCRDQARRER